MWIENSWTDSVSSGGSTVATSATQPSAKAIRSNDRCTPPRRASRTLPTT
jgi:hypothetical protein